MQFWDISLWVLCCHHNTVGWNWIKWVFFFFFKALRSTNKIPFTSIRVAAEAKWISENLGTKHQNCLKGWILYGLGESVFYLISCLVIWVTWVFKVAIINILTITVDEMTTWNRVIHTDKSMKSYHLECTILVLIVQCMFPYVSMNACSLKIPSVRMDIHKLRRSNGHNLK